jgi:hypothetical protein
MPGAWRQHARRLGEKYTAPADAEGIGRLRLFDCICLNARNGGRAGDPAGGKVGAWPIGQNPAGWEGGLAWAEMNPRKCAECIIGVFPLALVKGMRHPAHSWLPEQR